MGEEELKAPAPPKPKNRSERGGLVGALENAGHKVEEALVGKQGQTEAPEPTPATSGGKTIKVFSDSTGKLMEVTRMRDAGTEIDIYVR